jgi:hypothetical protein
MIHIDSLRLLHLPYYLIYTRDAFDLCQLSSHPVYGTYEFLLYVLVDS